MSFFEPMAFRDMLFRVGYGLPKNDGRLVLIKRQRRARPDRARMLFKLTNTFFIPNVTFRKSSNIVSNNKHKNSTPVKIYFGRINIYRSSIP